MDVIKKIPGIDRQLAEKPNLVSFITNVEPQRLYFFINSLELFTITNGVEY
jgi:hypothetical protein